MSRRTIGFARQNRKNMTQAEFALWTELAACALGVRFRRQDPIGPYIADFSCRSHRIIVEVDGISHDSPERDRRRDRWFASQGWLVLRFDDEDVLSWPDQTVELIQEALVNPRLVQDPWNLEG
jgi:BirA family biotin operon repressor/biotin-[acetyl-CoA-carboxylase] ligase